MSSFNHGKWVWKDGEIVAWKDANVHLSTHTLHYGTSVFEGIKAYNGKIFKCLEHMKRLHASCDMIGLKVHFSAEQLTTAAEKLIEKNGQKNAYIRPLAWFGEGLGNSMNGLSTHVAILTGELNTDFKVLGKKTLSLKSTPYSRIAPTMGFPSAKASGQYLTGSVIKTKAILEGYDDCLMLDHEGFVAETTSSNIFIAKNGKLFTPIPDRFLNGITRLTVIDLAKGNGIEVEEKRITVEELQEADEVFLTGTAYEISPVSSIDDNTYEFGPITQKIRDLFFDLVTK